MYHQNPPTVCPSGWAGLKSSSSTFELNLVSCKDIKRGIAHLLSSVELLVGSKEDVLVTQLVDRHSSFASDHGVDSANLVLLLGSFQLNPFYWQINMALISILTCLTCTVLRNGSRMEWKLQFVVHTLLATSQATSKHHWLLSLEGNHYWKQWNGERVSFPG